MSWNVIGASIAVAVALTCPARAQSVEDFYRGRTVTILVGFTAGGGYELALACDEIAMVDDRSTTVSLPEVPLLGDRDEGAELAEVHPRNNKEALSIKSKACLDGRRRQV